MKLYGLMVAASAALLTTPAAFAALPAEQGYGGGAGVQGELAQGGSLPFTGLDLALLLIGGLMLVIMGMTIRRVVRRRA